MMFTQAHLARFLASDNFEIPKAIAHVKEYLTWRNH